MKIDRFLFFACQVNLSKIAFSQTEEWLDACHYDQDSVRFFVDSSQNTNIACWGVETRSRLLGTKLNINGISLNDSVSIEQYRQFFASIIDEDYDIIDVSDISVYSTDFEVAIRRAGFVRPLGINLCPLTIIVDVNTTDYKFHRNWRRQVRKSKESGNSFEVVDNPTYQDAEKFVALFQSLKERKSLGFSISAEEIELMLHSKKYQLFFINNSQGERVCGRIAYIHNGRVYDVYAANSDASMASGAIYHIQEEILRYCGTIGCVEFDYGRVSPSADHMDNIYVSKSYSGGRVAQYNGQWHYAKSPLKDALYSMYRYGFRRNRHY